MLWEMMRACFDFLEKKKLLEWEGGGAGTRLPPALPQATVLSGHYVSFLELSSKSQYFALSSFNTIAILNYITDPPAPLLRSL